MFPGATVPADPINAGITALGVAAMEADFDGARLCLAQVQELAANAGLNNVVLAADRVAEALGPAGGPPGLDLGQAFAELARAASRLVDDLS
ncbi:hypothetical protein KPL74_01770 [Bacillus sp. NP157]|nr:hypothetical protein KPL74_01770 [Bacillus sp. NP157]